MKTSYKIKISALWLFEQLPLLLACAMVAIVTAHDKLLGLSLGMMFLAVYFVGRSHVNLNWKRKLSSIERESRLRDVEQELDRLDVPEDEREYLMQVWSEDTGSLKTYPSCSSCGSTYDPNFHVAALPRQAKDGKCAVCCSNSGKNNLGNDAP